MIEQIWTSCGLFFEKESDAQHYGLGKGEWGDNVKPEPRFILYDPETENYYPLISNKPVEFYSLDDEKIKQEALAKLTQKEKEVLGLDK